MTNDTVADAMNTVGLAITEETIPVIQVEGKNKTVNETVYAG